MTSSLARYRGVLLFGLVLLALAGLILIQARRSPPAPLLLATAPALPSAGPTATPPPLRVYVSGAVLQPDVYALAPGSIVKDALLAAGGPAPDADLDGINLAQSLADGQQIYVPRQGEVDPPLPQRSGGPAAVGARVNINTADAATLESLPGIGPSLAQHILDHRQANGPFATIEEIVDVPGIGPATFEEIRDLITTK